MTGDAKGVEAVERACRVLDCFDGTPPLLSLAELARRSGLYKSTILRLGVSLERCGHLVREADGRFRLGPAVWRLGAVYRASYDLGDLVPPELERLMQATGETASFFVQDGDGRICLYRSEPSRAIRHSIRVGSRLPLDRGAGGRVLTAFGEGAGAATAASAEIRARGWAVSLGERDPEVAAVAAPVHDSAGALRGALAVSGLITRFGPDRLVALRTELMATQARLVAAIADRR